MEILVLFLKKENSKLNTLNIYSLSKLSNEIIAKSFLAKNQRHNLLDLDFSQFMVNGADQIC